MKAAFKSNGNETETLTDDQALDRETTRFAIIEAAASEFESNGFQATTLDQIARAAGVGRRTIYHYFNSKKEILAAVCLEQAKLFLAEIEERVKPSKDFPNYFFECLLYVIEQAPKSRFFMLNIAQGTGIDPISLYFGNPQLIQDWVNLFQKPFENAQQKGNINPDIKLIKLVNWFGRITTSYLRYSLEDETPEEIRESLKVFTLSALRYNTYSPL